MPQVLGAHRDTLPGMDTVVVLNVGMLLSATGTVVVTVLATGFALARMLRRMDEDRRADRAAADADRRTFQDAMQRLAERQSHVEGRLDERGAAAD